GRPPLRAGAQHSAQLLHIIGAARLRPGAEARALPSTEGLPPDDGPRRRPVHVQVTGPHALDELRLLTFVEAVEAGSEAVSGAVGEPERVGKILRGQHGEQRTEELRAIDVAAGRDAQLDPWTEEMGVLRGARGLEEPTLACLQLQAARQGPRGRSDQGRDEGARIPS